MAETIILDPTDGASSTNLVTNPKAATGTTGWTNTSLTTFAQVTLGSGGAPAASATLSALGVTTAIHGVGDAAADRGACDVAVVNGTTYRWSVYIYLDSHTTAGIQLRIDNSSAVSKGATSTLTTDDTWTRLDVSVTADETATWKLRVQQNTAGATDFYWTAALVEASSSLGAYFDGDTPSAGPASRYVWTGVSNQSTSQRITSRTDLNITDFIKSDGVDWGDAAIEQYLAKAQVGSIPVDYSLPNRTVEIPLLLTQRGGTTFDTIRRQVQAKVGLWQREGGYLSRATSAGTLYMDVMNATLHMGGDWMQARTSNPADVGATLSLECRPDFYGQEITLDSMTTSGAELTGVLKLSGSNATIGGDYPGRCRIVVSETASIARFGLLSALRSRNYSSATTAALAYEAEALTPLDSAAGTLLSGASGGTVVRHGALASAAWTPVLSTRMLTGTADLTHVGSYRVWTRAYTTSSAPPRVRLVWDAGEINAPAENTAKYVPAGSAFYDLDLGEVRLDEAPVGPHKWQGRIEGRGDAGGENVSIDKVWFVPLDEAYSLLRMSPSTLAGAISARDSFTGTSSGGTLNGRTADVGGTAVWASSGAATDLTFMDADAISTGLPPSEAVGRSASSASLRFAVFGPIMTDQNVSARAGASAPASQGTGECGVIARWVDSSNYLRFTATVTATSKLVNADVKLTKVVAGTPTVLTSRSVVGVGNYRTMSLAVSANGNVTALLYSATGALLTSLQWSDSTLATGGALDDGRAGIVDSGDGTNAVQRWYDDVVVSTPAPEPVVLNSGRSSELRWDGHYRQASDGTGYDAINIVSGDLPRLPPSGLENRPVELFVKASRGDFDQVADTGATDSISAQVKYRPSYLFAPGT